MLVGPPPRTSGKKTQSKKIKKKKKQKKKKKRKEKKRKKEKLQRYLQVLNFASEYSICLNKLTILHGHTVQSKLFSSLLERYM